ncbi:MAG TPA: GAF domain-containing protein, partial [Chloroflexi bacterium]|nr:GAF domain-containing protein [Chloroflexota bacterium]
MGLEDVLARLAEGARQISRADAVTVCLLEDDGDLEAGRACLKMLSSSGLPEALDVPTSISVRESPVDREALAGRSVLIEDARIDPRAENLPGDYRSALCVPLRHGQTPLGTLHAYALSPGFFAASDRDSLEAMADLGAMTIGAIQTTEVVNTREQGRAQFIRVATHELRSPVAVAQSMVRGVLKGYAGEMTPKQADIFVRISRRLDFLEHLINDLLDLAAGKAAAGAGEDVQAVLLNASLGRAVLLLLPQAEEKGVTLAHRPSGDELVVRGTEDGLDRIFVNLIGNAAKYTPPGGRVEVLSRRVGDEIEVRVSDTGIGIPPEALAHLFEEFYRAPNAKFSDEVGTGLGLAIVKDLVDRCRADITVKSVVDEG